MVRDEQGLEVEETEVELRAGQDIVEGEVVEGEVTKTDGTDPPEPESHVLLQTIEQLVASNDLVQLSRDVLVVVDEPKRSHAQLFEALLEILQVWLCDSPDAA